jgi:phage tail sheath protein FI
MPEYLAPGVYVEEVSFRSKSIEGVPTSTTGMAGLARYGPVQYAPYGATLTATPRSTEPRLVTSYTEFERVYGGIEPLLIDGDERTAYLAHAARAFFANGGQRLYVSRVFVDDTDPASPGFDPAANHTAYADVPTSNGTAHWRARWPGLFGNVLVDTRVVRSKNMAFAFPADPTDILHKDQWGVQVKNAHDGAVVEILSPKPLPKDLPKDNDPLVEANLAVVRVDAMGRQTFALVGGGNPAALAQGLNDVYISLVELRVDVYRPGAPVDSYTQLGGDVKQRRYIGKVLEADDPEDENAIVWLDWTPDPNDGFAAARLMKALREAPQKRLDHGDDGTTVPGPSFFDGNEADPDHVEIKATGLAALDEIDDIAIIAMPDMGDMDDDVEVMFTAAQALVTHAENQKYRIAVVDPPANCSMTEIREYRGRFDSKYAAMYHPWIEILDPLYPIVPGTPPRKLLLPPSGFVTGIYARSDIERGVHKAPANEIVRGLTKFEININKARQDVLNPEGVNCLRFFEGRGNRVWGARTMSSDPEWKYVNVRRLFIYLEHSLDKATQWAVFEPNAERLWKNIKQTVEDFLLVMWRDGWLVGAKPEDAYFVRCDRTTMLQNDLDNGRMICLVGVSPSRPAEYVIFRVGQWTADSKT